jgi:hypothetical protein
MSIKIMLLFAIFFEIIFLFYLQRSKEGYNILTGCSSLKWAIDTRLVLPLPWIGIYFHLYSNDITVTTIDFVKR